MAVKAQDLTKDYKYGFSDPEQYSFKSRRGLDPEISYQDPGILPRQELADLPLPRELVVRLEVRRN